MSVGGGMERGFAKGGREWDRGRRGGKRWEGGRDMREKGEKRGDWGGGRIEEGGEYLKYYELKLLLIVFPWYRA